LGIPIISEEGELIDYSKRKDWKQCWIIDPLDGTKEFIKRNDEFTVNIALIDNGVPVAGVIYVPVFKQLYFGDIELGSYRLDKIISWDANLEFAIKTAVKLPLDVKREVTVVVGSRSHMNVETRNYISQLEKESDVEILSKGSSLKLCLIAENKADVYPRFAPTMEWDIAAGHAIVAATGAKVMQLNTSEQLIYNKENLLNPWFVCKR
jgi:3'(2'), 5'-bisphosphate nucleotidase